MGPHKIYNGTNYAGNFLPALTPVNEKELVSHWQIFFKTQMDYSRFNSILRNSPWISYCLPQNIINNSETKKRSKKSTKNKNMNISNQIMTMGVWHPSFLFSLFINSITDLLVRMAFHINEKDIPALPDSWESRLFKTLLEKNAVFTIQKFYDTPIPNIMRNWIQNARGFAFDLGVSICFQLESPSDDNTDWKIQFYFQPLQDPTHLLPMASLWDSQSQQFSELAQICPNLILLKEQTLRALGTAVILISPLERSLEETAPCDVILNPQEVMEFMRTGMYLLIQAGFKVKLPAEFAAQGQQRVSAQLIIQPVSAKKKTRIKGGATFTPIFGMDTVLEYRWEAQVDGQPLSDQEF